MWLLPLLAAIVALVFAVLLGRRWVERRRPYLVLWALSMLMYAIASFALALGVVSGWSEGEFQVFWLFGAVLTVPFLAVGELFLLVPNRTLHAALVILLVFVCAYALNVVRTADIVTGSLDADLPSGKHVFGAGTAAHRLPQLVSIPSYLILLGGALWSASRMRSEPRLRDRFFGTLAVAGGATVIAVVGSAFAAVGNLPVFSIALAAGIATMFWGFLRASRAAATADRG